MPQIVLYNPIVLSEQWYNQLQPDLGHLVVQVQCPECAISSGMGAYNMSYVENQAGYKAKIPLFSNGFEYPISHISIDFVKGHPQDGVSYFAQDLVINESYYSIDSGNLYFTMPVEEIISEKYQFYDDVLHEIRIGSYADSNIYYDMHIYFDIFIPDTTEETHNLALAQATSYAIMDYFNQYTYAEITANMISEIAYTESVTFWSTLISAPLMWFGSWTTKGTETALGQAGSKSIGAVIAKGMAQVITAPIKEVFEEIIKDGFIEAFAEGLTDIMGWAEDVGFWISSMATSGRETVGSLGKIALGKTGVKANFKNAVALSRAVAAGDMKAVADIQQKIKQEAQQQLELAQQREQDKSMWQKLIGSNFFKGFTMMMPGLFVGTFDFLSFAGLSNMLAGAINIVPSAYAHYRAKIQAYKSNKITKVVGDKALYSYDILVKQMKKPADIDGEALNNLFRGLQETGIINEPAIDISVLFNPNPIQTQQIEIFSKFQELSSAKSIQEKFQYKREDEKMLDEEQIYRPTIHKTEISIADEEGVFSSFDRDLIEYLYNEFLLLEDRQPQKAPDKKISRIPFPVDLLRDAIDMLSSTCYDGLPVIVEKEQDIAINDEISSKIINKIESGLQINKLERIIMDVGILIAGGYQIDGKVNSESDFNENSIEKIKENQDKLIVAKVLGVSMYPILKPGTDVPIKTMPQGYKYKTGDIIVFSRDGVNIIHQIIDSYVYNGKIYYVTSGLNPDTNPYVDSSTISEEHIIGKADISKEALAGIDELVKQGRVHYIGAFGLINYGDSEVYRSVFEDGFNKLREQIETLDKSYKEKLLNEFLKENLFDTLVEYSQYKENEYKEYAEKDGVIKSIHNPTWNNDDNAKRVQRLLWGILTDFRHPLTGEKIDNLEEWLSFSLHHWRTSDGQLNNKYDCRFLSLIPLPRAGDKGHSQITAQIRIDENRGLYWENEIRKAIKSIFEGEAPKSWIPSSKDAFNTYAKSIKQVRELIKMFIAHDPNFMKELKLI